MKPHVGDSIFTPSILFRNPPKFKIMETKEVAYTGENVQKPNGGPGGHIAPFTEEFVELMKARKFKRRYMHRSERFSLKPDDLQKLLSVPGFAEISIFPGIQDNEIVLFLVPVVKVNKKNELRDAADPATELVCVYEQSSNLNGEDRTSSTTTILTGAPCPPYPPHCTYCCPQR